MSSDAGDTFAPLPVEQDDRGLFVLLPFTHEHDARILEVREVGSRKMS